MQHLLSRAKWGRRRRTRRPAQPELATRMITRFLDSGHRVPWVAGDEVYGGNPALRAALEGLATGYVLAVACTHEVATGAGKFRADTLAKRLPKRAWQKLSAGPGAKGHRYYDWAHIDLGQRGPGPPRKPPPWAEVHPRVPTVARRPAAPDIPYRDERRGRRIVP